MVSSKVLSNASFVCPARFASATTPSEMMMVMDILYTEGEDEMSSLAGTPFHLDKLQHLSDLFLMFFPFLSILFGLVLPVSMRRCSSSCFLCLFCFLRLEELIDVVFPSLSRLPTALLDLHPRLRPESILLLFWCILTVGEKRSSFPISI